MLLYAYSAAEVALDRLQTKVKVVGISETVGRLVRIVASSQRCPFIFLLLTLGKLGIGCTGQMGPLAILQYSWMRCFGGNSMIVEVCHPIGFS